MKTSNLTRRCWSCQALRDIWSGGKTDKKLKMGETGNIFFHSPAQQNGNDIRRRKHKNHSQSAKRIK
jgi:hypothetical protein